MGALGTAFSAASLRGQTGAGAGATLWTVEQVASTLGEPIPFGAVPPGGIRFGDDGRIHVLDVQAAQIYIFDSGLTPAGSLGGRGRGPGEFIQPSLLGVGSGTVAVFDPATSRITVFEQGAHAWDVSWPLVTRGIPRRIEVTGGTVLMEVEPFPVRDPRIHREAESLRVVRLHRDGSTRVLMAFPQLTTSDIGPTTSETPRPVVFAPSLHWTAGPGPRLFTSLSDRYRVETLDLESAHRETFATRPGLSAAPVSDSVQALVRERTLRRFAENRGQSALARLDADVVRQSIADMRFAEDLPLTGEVLHGLRDLLLVQRGIGLVDDLAASSEGPPLVSVAWDVFERDGTYAGVIEFPAGFVPVDGFGELVVGVREGELGEVMVEVFRVSRPGQPEAESSDHSASSRESISTS